MIERYSLKARVAANPIARKLAQMPKGDNIDEFAPAILKLMKGVPTEVWTVIDEQPGRWGYMNDRFYMLRQVRNHPEWGRKLFAGLKKEKRQ